MNWINNTSQQLFCLLLLLPLFFISGCATKQWRDPLDEKQEESLRLLLLVEQHKSQDCSSSIDAELSTTWTSQLGDGLLNGYIQIFLPSSIKIIGLNPLNQPLFAFATDGITFQSINALKGVYKYGRLTTFMKRFNIPDHVLKGDWAQWLTGSISFSDDQLKELRQDISSRGVWLTVEKKKGENISKEHLLFEPRQKQLIQRIVLDPKGREVANINYISWQKQQNCSLPTHIQVTGISFGGTINIKMTDIITNQTFTQDSFFLRLPEGYVQQKYP